MKMHYKQKNYPQQHIQQQHDNIIPLGLHLCPDPSFVCQQKHEIMANLHVKLCLLVYNEAVKSSVSKNNLEHLEADVEWPRESSAL